MERWAGGERVLAAFRVYTLTAIGVSFLVSDGSGVNPPILCRAQPWGKFQGCWGSWQLGRSTFLRKGFCWFHLRWQNNNNTPWVYLGFFSTQISEPPSGLTCLDSRNHRETTFCGPPFWLALFFYFFLFLPRGSHQETTFCGPPFGPTWLGVFCFFFLRKLEAKRQSASPGVGHLPHHPLGVPEAAGVHCGLAAGRPSL